MLIGATKLGFAEHFNFRLHVQKLTPNLGFELLYSVTNSFIYALTTDDFKLETLEKLANFEKKIEKDRFLSDHANSKIELKLIIFNTINYGPEQC